MPRAKQGGARSGQTGGQYANRSDLRNPGNETVKGQPYGEAAAQQAAQRSIPLTPPPTAISGAPQPGSGPQGGVGPSTQPASQGAPMAPGSMNLFAPTNRPNTPITHGLSIGAGAGPEAMQGTPIGMVAQNMAEGDSATSLLASLASKPGAGAVLRNLAGLATTGLVRG